MASSSFFFFLHVNVGEMKISVIVCRASEPEEEEVADDVDDVDENDNVDCVVAIELMMGEERMKEYVFCFCFFFCVLISGWLFEKEPICFLLFNSSNYMYYKEILRLVFYHSSYS